MSTGEPLVASIAALLADPPAEGTTVVVRGHVHACPTRVVVCEVLAESFPPQPAGAVLPLAGVEPGTPGMTRHGDDAWTPGTCTVRGAWRAGTLEVVDVTAP